MASESSDKKVSDKVWVWDAEVTPSAAAQKFVEQMATVEEALLYNGSAEGEKLAQELTKSTGFILEYALMTKEGVGLERELVEILRLPKDWEAAQQVLAKIRGSDGVVSKRLKDGTMSSDNVLALSLYTCGASCAYINSALRGGTLSEVMKCVSMAGNFVKGFRAMPSYWGTVFRGAVLPAEVVATYAIGTTIQMKGLTSASTQIEVARRFAENESKLQASSPGKRVLCLFEIVSRSGRSLEEVSVWPKEAEVVFRQFTSFRVVSAAVRGEWHEFKLEEMCPDVRGRKVLVWVDDRHTTESKLIMDLGEQGGVTFVHMHSTQAAVEFFAEHRGLLDRPVDRLRVITDMVRVEGGESQNIEAGLDLAKALRERFNYRKPLMCFAGPKYIAANRDKFVAAGFGNSLVTADRDKARQFATFAPL